MVVDTNVWISGLLSPRGAPADCTRRVLQHARPVFTRATFDELAERLWRPKFDRYITMELRRAFLGDVDAVADWVRPERALVDASWCRDADDDAFVRAAVAAQAPWLVTGDQDLLVLAPVLFEHGVRILSPANAVAAAAFPGAYRTP